MRATDLSLTAPFAAARLVNRSCRRSRWTDPARAWRLSPRCVRIRPLLDGGLVLGSLVTLLSLAGCKELTGNTPLPSGTQDPVVFNTPAGAVGMWAATLQALQEAIPSYLVHTGLLTDELQPLVQGANLYNGSSLSAAGSLDARILPSESFTGASGSGTVADQDYEHLQHVRGLANQALGALVTYDTGAHHQGDPIGMRSQLYAVQGYVEILLADFFCSGVPLSTLDYQKDFTYAPSSTWQQVYQDALVKLDSTYVLAGTHDSVALQQLAQVLKGRALLALGQYAQAAAAVAGVPTAFQYQVQMQLCGGTTGFVCQGVDDWIALFKEQATPTVSDREGGTGLPYLSAYVSGGDPRLAVDTFPKCGNGGCSDNQPAQPTKYEQQSTLPPGFILFTLADGIEAQLIEAEAQLNANPADTAWLHTLNLLRQTANIPGTSAPDPQHLPPLTDPGASLTGTAADTARLNLLFQERAYWLYLTGHRQGDLRRLIRQYGHQYPQYNQTTVYPTGPYPAPNFVPFYGIDVTAPIPGSEFINPKFHGCQSRSA